MYVMYVCFVWLYVRVDVVLCDMYVGYDVYVCVVWLLCRYVRCVCYVCALLK